MWIKSILRDYLDGVCTEQEAVEEFAQYRRNRLIISFIVGVFTGIMVGKYLFA